MITREQAQFLLEIINTQGLVLPLADGAKLKLAYETRLTLEKIAESETKVV